jgi:hypothetical protein
MKFHRFKSQNNYILLKPLAENTLRVVGKAGLVVGVPAYVKDQYLKNYQVRHFEVVKVPDKITLPGNKRQFAEMGYQPPYEEEMELKPKDIVWANLQAAHQAIKVNFIGKEGDYYLVHYSQIYVARRRCFHVNWDDKQENRLKFDDVMWDIIPLHGFVVCEKIFKKHPIIDRQDEVMGKLKVKWTGKCPLFIYDIKNGQLEKTEYNHLDVKSGDRVQLDGPWVAMESPLFQDFNGTANLCVVEQRFITAIL